MGRAANNPELQLTDKQYRGILDFIKDCRGNDRRIHVSYACEGFLGEYEQKVRDHLFYCRSGVEVASIRCNGAISGCTSVRSNMDQGNIYTDDLWDVWQNRFEVMRNRSWAKKGQCKSCKVWRYCEGSGLHLYDDNGELLTCHYRRLTANHK
jgi:radical SAM protein with 4Fe4S-binding SPASM domain